MKVRDAQGTRHVNIAWVFLDPLLVLFKSNKISSSVQPSHESSSCVCTKTAFLFPLTAWCHVFSIVLLQLAEWCQCGGVGVKHTASPGSKLEGKPTLNHYSCCQHVLYAQIQSPGSDLTLCLHLLCVIYECVAPPCIKVSRVLQNQKRMKVLDCGGIRQCSPTLFCTSLTINRATLWPDGVASGTAHRIVSLSGSLLAQQELIKVDLSPACQTVCNRGT